MAMGLGSQRCCRVDGSKQVKQRLDSTLRPTPGVAEVAHLTQLSESPCSVCMGDLGDLCLLTDTLSTSISSFFAPPDTRCRFVPTLAFAGGFFSAPWVEVDSASSLRSLYRLWRSDGLFHEPTNLDLSQLGRGTQPDKERVPTSRPAGAPLLQTHRAGCPY